MSMRLDSNDPWLSPTRQRELPLREMLAAERLHGRRESTFLTFATMFVFAAAAMVLLGATQAIDVDGTLAELGFGRELPVDLAVPLGALGFPLTLFAIAMVREHYGSRRAGALIVAGLMAMLAAMGLAQIASLDPALTLGWSLALIAAYVVSQLVHAAIYGGLVRSGSERRWVRKTVAMLFAQLTGWAVFGMVGYGYATRSLGVEGSGAITQASSLAAGAAAYAIGVGLIDLIPFIAVASGLAIFLRVGRGAPEEEEADDASPEAWELAIARARRLPEAVVVDDAPEPRRARQPTLPPAPFTHAELRFFTEGDELSEAAST